MLVFRNILRMYLMDHLQGSMQKINSETSAIVLVFFYSMGIYSKYLNQLPPTKFYVGKPLF